MNRIPALYALHRFRPANTVRLTSRLLATGIAACAGTFGAAVSESADPNAEQDRTYEIEYVVKPDVDAGGAWVEMRLAQASALLREVDMRAPSDTIRSASGDGKISVADERLVWQPPERGGRLRWFARIDHERDSGTYDAHIESRWAIFRAEDVIPQARTRTLRGAVSKTTLSFDLPSGWSSVTEYFGREHSYRIVNRQRRFDRPAGWIILGQIGVRYDRVAGIRVNVVAPTGHGMRRNDILALLNWSLPEVLRMFPGFPDRLTIIGAGDPMWRGGLSGPRSLYIHTERPLISENGTSSLLHEIVHIAVGRSAANGMDWIVEGLAEYYSLVILHRSGTISDRRFTAAMRKQAEWGSSVRKLCRVASGGAVTARAVTIMAALDAEIRAKSDGENSLDDILAKLASSDEDLTLEHFTGLARQMIDSSPAALRPAKLPGCGT